MLFSTSMLYGFIQDLRFAERSLRRQPVVLITTILLLGLGIGASTVLFSAINALLLRPLPVSHPRDLVRLVQVRPNLGARSDFSYAFLTAARKRFEAVRDIFAWESLNVSFTRMGEPERIRIHVVSGNYFDALGIKAALGRGIEPSDDQASKATVAVLSDGFWRRRFGGDPRVLGRSITLNGVAFTVIGVMPAGFTDISIETSPDVRVPIEAAPLMVPGIYLNRPDFTMYFDIAGRLRPGVSIAQARDELAALYTAVLSAESSEEARRELEAKVQTDVESISTGTSSLRRQFGTALLALIGGAAVLLIMVSANVAGLLIARSASRGREWAVRLAVGASRWRLARLMLAESVLLATFGILAGLVFAIIALPLLVRAIPPIRDLDATSLPVTLSIDIDWRVMLFASAAGLFTAIAVSVAPALRATREDLHTMLRSIRATRGAAGRSFGVALQVALCTLLLNASALFVQTFAQLRTLDPGFDRDHIATFSVDPALASYTGVQSRDLQKRLLEQVRGIPGVADASIAGRGVMRGTGVKSTFAPVGERAARSDFLNSSLNFVTPEYFDTMGIRFVDGRNFRIDEVMPKGEPRRVIVNQAFVRRFYPKGRPIGERFGVAGQTIAKPDNEIIGVVSDAKYRSLRELVPPTVYSMWTAEDGRAPTFILHVRTRTRPDSIIASVRGILAKIDARLPFYEITTLSEEVDRSIWQERLVAWLSLGFAIIAALLAGTGIYGLLSYAVTQRIREIGIRAALGARPIQIIELITRRPVKLTLIGAAAGLGASAIVLRWLRPLLFGVTALPVSAMVAVAGAVLVIGAAASMAPAVRAARIDPAATLRAE